MQRALIVSYVVGCVFGLLAGLLVRVPGDIESYRERGKLSNVDGGDVFLFVVCIVLWPAITILAILFGFLPWLYEKTIAYLAKDPPPKPEPRTESPSYREEPVVKD